MDVVKAILNAGWRSPWSCEAIYEENKYKQGGIWCAYVLKVCGKEGIIILFDV